MASSAEFVAHCLERLAPLGEIRAKRMFGGHGLYLEDRIFGLITSSDEIFFKSDDRNRAVFEAAGLSPFKPWDDKPMMMPYYPVPEEDLEDQDAFLGWARLGMEAALRAPVKPAKGKKAR